MGGRAVLLGIATAVLAVKVGVADRADLLWRRTRLLPDGQLRGAEAPRDVPFGQQAVLLGTEGLPDTFAADAAPTLTLYWRALAPTGEDWQVGVAFVGQAGAGGTPERWQAALQPVRWARTPPPMVAWSPDSYARMDYAVGVPAGMPPGRYTVVLSLFDRATAAPVSVLGSDGNPEGPELALGQVALTPPETPASLAALGVTDETPLRCGPVALWQAELDRTAAAPGDLVSVRTVWEALLAPTEALSVTLTLQDDQGDTLRSWDFPAVAPWWPTDRWQGGQRWVGRAQARLPGSLESGAYVLSLTLAGCDLGAWPLTVAAPERMWRLPQGYARSGAELGGVVVLAGYQVGAQTAKGGETLPVALAWEGLAEMSTSYKVFVHLVDADGHLLTQNDGEPALWTRPTTGWAVGEVVVDPRDLAIPGDASAGVYEVRVGMYGPDGVRLQMPNGQDSVVIAVVRVE